LAGLFHRDTPKSCSHLKITWSLTSTAMDESSFLSAEQVPSITDIALPEALGHVGSSTEFDFESWSQYIEGLSTENPGNFSFPPQTLNPDIGAEALSHVQTGVNDWFSTVIQDTTGRNWDSADSFGADSTGGDFMAVNLDESADDAERVCYGMVHQVKVRLVGDMSELSRKLESLVGEPGMKTCMVQLGPLESFDRSDPLDRVCLVFPDNAVLGQAEDKRRRSIPRLLSMSSLNLEAMFSPASLLARLRTITSKKDAIIFVDINIYGPASQAAQVGDHLAKYGVWLQKPDHLKRSVRYENPHKIQFPELLQEEVVIQNVPAPTELADGRILQLEQAVLAESQRTSHQKGTAGDIRLKTKLLPHQETGLSFMLERESGDVPDEFRLWKPAIINGREMWVQDTI
jgi:hypothetical protein